MATTNKPYDQFGGRFVLPIGAASGLAIDGTIAALTAEAGSIHQVPFACKLLAGTRWLITGATDAVAAVSAVICKSVAGTGSLSAVGTYVWNGTCATGAVGSAASVATGTSAEFAANDTVSISEAIGTVASIATHAFMLEFEELPQ